MERFFVIREKEIHDGLNSALLEETVRIVYEMLYTDFFRSEDERKDFRVLGSVISDGIQIQVILDSNPGEGDDGHSGLVKRPVSQVVMTSSGLIKGSGTMSARSSLKTAFHTDKIGVSERRSAFIRKQSAYVKHCSDKTQPVTSKKSAGSRLEINEHVDSKRFRDEYEKRLSRFMDNKMDEIYGKIKSPISKVQKNA